VILQEGVKKRYLKFLAETGCKQNFICLKLGINESSLSRWKKDRLNLTICDLNSLDAYLKNNGY
jgi:ferredoxin-fold anticodon binding domain-containing protein